MSRKVSDMGKNKYALEVEGVSKLYNPGKDSEVAALRNVSLGIERGSFISILGPSGSGKTTLIDVLGCLSKPTEGKVLVNGVATEKMDENELARVRRENVGFVFQQYNLIPSSSALDNVALALRIAGKSKGEAQKRARELLTMVGLEKRMNHRPPELSGGEQQRVAISRALANDPQIIFGDEPTGNLDTKTGAKILALLKELNKEKGYTIIVVTHDPRIRKYCDRVIHLMDGKIVKDAVQKREGG